MSATRLDGLSAAVILAAGVAAATPAQAAFRATGEVGGLMCAADGADCAPVNFDEANVPGRFALTMGALFDAVSARDAATGLCRIDLADDKLAEASTNMRNLLRAKFIVNSHDGPQEVNLNTLEFACVEE